MNSFFKILRPLAPLALSIFLWTPAAEASFAIMPMETQLKLPEEGNAVTDEIEVYNGGDKALHISSSVMDWNLTPDGDYQYAQAGTDPSSCAPWIQLNPPEFNVGPKQSVHVRYSVTSPGALTDEHRAMIFFESRPVPFKGQERLGLQVATRMGCKVFISPHQALAKNATITDMELQSAPAPRVRVSLKNPGVATFRASGTVQVLSAAGEVVAQGALSSAQLVPGGQRNLWFSPPAALQPGVYTIKAVIDYGAQQNLGGELKTTLTDTPAKG